MDSAFLKFITNLKFNSYFVSKTTMTYSTNTDNFFFKSDEEFTKFMIEDFELKPDVKELIENAETESEEK